MTTTRVFRSGNSQAVRIPADRAYADPPAERTITRVGDVITLYPVHASQKDAFAALDALPAAPLEPIERTDLPVRDWD